MLVNVGGQQRKLAWRPDKPDHRDHVFATPPSVKALPPKMDLRQWCSAVEDQGDIGSCTAHAATSAMEFLYRRGGKSQPELSRLFLYYATRVWTEKVSADDDSGCEIRNVVKTLSKYGTCLEANWPYAPSRFGEEPPRAAVAEAQGHQVLSYYRHPTHYAVRAALASGYPVVGGFSCPESVSSEETAKTGLVRLPDMDESIVGGHAILLVGYDDLVKEYLFKNSWGKDWGAGGYGRLPYRFATGGLLSDCWSVRTEEM